MLNEIWDFIKNPIYKEDENEDAKYRLGIVFRVLVIALVISIVLSAVIGLVEEFLTTDLGTHAIEITLETYSPWFLLFAAVILAPLIEELIFRGPMVYFRNKSYFNYAFYILTIIFGFVHLSNFEINTNVLLLSPILVAPQISAGIFLGFIRVRLGLIWAIVLHSLYNLVLIGPIITFHLLDISFE